MISVVPTGDLGLDVLLGGGWRLVRRFEDKKSATVIVRGGSGAGKTLVGIQAALELATALGGDVAVGCVEILPTEYMAQLQSARPSLPADRVAHMPARAASVDGPRVYVGLLKLDGDEPDLVTALEQLGVAVREAGGNPTAFIVDSLIDGYGIGSSVDRVVADDVLRFAANYGHALVLCEEITSDVASPWVFAADTVLQVGVESRERGRWIEVRKHRFGPSATGRHELELNGPGRPSVYPGPHAWLLRDALTAVRAYGWHFTSPARAPQLVWQIERLDSKPHFGAFAMVTSDSQEIARGLALAWSVVDPVAQEDLVFELDPLARRDDDSASEFEPNVCFLAIAGGAARALRVMVERFARAFTSDGKPGVGRIVIGDVGLVGGLPEGAAWFDALVAFAGMVSSTGWGISLIGYDGVRDSEERGRLVRAADLAIDVAVARELDQYDWVSAEGRWPHRANRSGWKRGELRQALMKVHPTAVTDLARTRPGNAG